MLSQVGYEQGNSAISPYRTTVTDVVFKIAHLHTHKFPYGPGAAQNVDCPPQAMRRNYQKEYS